MMGSKDMVSIDLSVNLIVSIDLSFFWFGFFMFWNLLTMVCETVL